jgi:DNA-binding phage protein
METLKIEIHWCDKNFCCGWGFDNFGAIVVTAKTLEGVKHEFEDALNLQITEMLKDNEFVPEFLANKDFTIEYSLHTSALLRDAERFTTMAAISRATGINQKQLSHYASSLKEPRPAQRQRIIDGLHEIGRQFLALS